MRKVVPPSAGRHRSSAVPALQTKGIVLNLHPIKRGRRQSDGEAHCFRFAADPLECGSGSPDAVGIVPSSQKMKSQTNRSGDGGNPYLQWLVAGAIWFRRGRAFEEQVNWLGNSGTRQCPNNYTAKNKRGYLLLKRNRRGYVPSHKSRWLSGWRLSRVGKLKRGEGR